MSGPRPRRIASSRELDVPPPEGLTTTTVTMDGEPRMILSFPLRAPRWPDTLTPAERAVAEMLLDGASNAEIAAARGTSERTVTNQVASIFRKANASSRVELAARVYGT